MAVRNAVTALMKTSGYGVGYRYPHDFAGGVTPEHESHLPEELKQRSYVPRGTRGWEADAWGRLDRARAGAGSAEDSGEDPE